MFEKVSNATFNQDKIFCLDPLILKPIVSIFLFIALSSANAEILEKNSTSTRSTNEIETLDELREEIESLKQKLESIEPNNPTPLSWSGFFDITAKNTTSTDNPFNLGGLELGIQYDQVDNFAVSVAFVWSEDVAEIGVAVLDYHANNHNIPTRGRLFGEPGYHVQFGRFDIPFGVDYEYFAATDRPNITAPLTTQRIENDGLNGDGLRAYGTWSQFDYAIYWTNSVLKDNGTTIGGRLGFFPSKDEFRIHNKTPQNDFIIGLSWLQDLDSEENTSESIYAIDLSISLGITNIIFEYVSSDSNNPIILNDPDLIQSNDEKGFNARFLFDFDIASVFFSYGEWKPEFSSVVDQEDLNTYYSVETLKRVTIGTNYLIDDYLQIKIEYIDHLDTRTEEPEFEENTFTLQMVASF